MLQGDSFSLLGPAAIWFPRSRRAQGLLGTSGALATGVVAHGPWDGNGERKARHQVGEGEGEILG